MAQIKVVRCWTDSNFLNNIVHFLKENNILISKAYHMPHVYLVKRLIKFEYLLNRIMKIAEPCLKHNITTTTEITEKT